MALNIENCFYFAQVKRTEKSNAFKARATIHKGFPQSAFISKCPFVILSNWIDSKIKIQSDLFKESPYFL